MAVSGQAKELIDQREKRITDDGTRTYRRKFRVTVTEADDDGNIALTAPGLPQRYFQYVTASSQDTAARCTEITATQVPASPYHWDVEAIYSTTFRDQREEQQEQDNPLLALPDIEWGFETVQIPIIGTPDQNIQIAGSTAPLSGAIKTPAGEIINPPPLMDESRPVVTITRNELNFNTLAALMYHNAVNSDFFFGVPARCAKCRGITGRLTTSKDVTYWQVTYTIAFKRDTWDHQQLNYGTLYLAAAGSTAAPLRFMSGPSTDALSVPIMGFLNTDGTARASTSTPTFSIYRIHKELPFSALNLPLGPNR